MNDHQKCIRPLTCPTCHQFLQKDGSRLVCAAGHSYDLAREGYVNLLPTHKRLPSTVGDSVEMLRARRQFLESGLYAPLVNRMKSLAREILIGYTQDDATAVSLLDCGCGEGYYLGQVMQQMAEALVPVGSFGLDVAKTAVKMAAKAYPTPQFVVSDVNGRLPFADQSIHLLLNIFAPRNAQEFARVCTGSLLVVIPKPTHLQTLRQKLRLLDIESNKPAKLQTQFQPAFHQRHTETITFPLLLNQQQLRSLVQMTPSARHLSLTQLQEMTQTSLLETTASFQVLLFEKMK